MDSWPEKFSFDPDSQQKLNAIISERNMWIDRPSQKKFKDLLSSLPLVNTSNVYSHDGTVHINLEQSIEQSQILNCAEILKKWKKGPFEIGGVRIESEWRSDLKWNRLLPFLPELKDKYVLDIGCNNGYYMFRASEHDPAYVLGIDPVGHFKNQFSFLNHFAQDSRLDFQLLGVEHVSYFQTCFDVVFFMGIIYHHRHPLEQLQSIYQAMRPGGSLILETIGIPGSESVALFPEGRYAGMKNVWFVPTLSCLENWMKRTHFKEIQVISSEWGGPNEQRSTEWSQGPSYQEFLDPEDSTKTKEGYPAPKRFILIGKKQ